MAAGPVAGKGRIRDGPGVDRVGIRRIGASHSHKPVRAAALPRWARYCAS